MISRSTVSAHQRYNDLLEKSAGAARFLQDLAETAYQIAQTEESGPRGHLIRLAEAATNAAIALNRAKPL